MIMLKEERSFEWELFWKDIGKYFDPEEKTGNNTTSVFTIAGQRLAIAHIPVPIPAGDIEETAKYAYNWENVLEDVSQHKSHLIVSVMHGEQDQVTRFKIFTQVLCSLLRTTSAIGIYKGNQSLLIQRDDYLSEAELMSEDYLPINLWVYFGLRVTESGNSGYTYGLKEFGKNEMEVINSSRPLEEVRGFLFNIVHYLLQYNVVFKDGQTIGSSEDEKIPITLSPGELVSGETFKFLY